MAIARAHLVNPALARWYHCVTRCVRRAFVLGEGHDDRKGWIEQRLQELAQIFAVAVGGFSVMDNHLPLLLRIDPDTAKDWSAYIDLNPVAAGIEAVPEAGPHTSFSASSST